MTDVPAQNPRPTYRDGQVLSVADFEQEQAFHIAMREEETRRLFAPGVLGGLAVAQASIAPISPTLDASPKPVGITVSPGAALDAFGRLLVLSGLAQDVSRRPYPASDGNVVVRLDDRRSYPRGQTVAFTLTMAFDEASADPARMVSAPVLSLLPGLVEAGSALILADLAVTAPPLPTAAGPTAPPPPDPPFDLIVTVSGARVAAASLLTERLPATISAAKIAGTLALDQVPTLPAAKIAGTLALDQVPTLPAAKIAGTLALDQVPTLPAAKIAGTLALDQVPTLPAAKIAGTLAVDQIPALDRLAGTLSPDRLSGPLATAQIPLLVEILRRLDALEGRPASITGRAFSGSEAVATQQTTAQQAAYRSKAGGAQCPNDLAAPLDDGFTVQMLVRPSALGGDQPLLSYRLSAPPADGSWVLPNTKASAFTLKLVDGRPVFSVAGSQGQRGAPPSLPQALQIIQDALRFQSLSPTVPLRPGGGVQSLRAGGAVAVNSWTLITLSWKAGTARFVIDDQVPVSGPVQGWRPADGAFDFATDGAGGFVGDIAWFTLWKGEISADQIASTPRRPLSAVEVASWTRWGLAGHWPLSGLTSTLVPDFTPVSNTGQIISIAPPRPTPPPAIHLPGFCAAQQGGNRGIEFWIIGDQGQVSTRYQISAGGPWSSWEGPGFKGQSKPLRRLAAAQQNNGNVMLFALDEAGSAWAIGQGSPGGDWSRWDGPALHGQPRGFTEIAAAEQNGNRGVELWALDDDGRLWTLYQVTAGGAWSGWEGPGFKNQPSTMTQIAAALQNNGCVMLFALDLSGRIWAIGQGAPGGDWGAWNGPSIKAQPHAFLHIAASEQKGNRGVELWALGDDGNIWTLYQVTPGGAWSNWEGPGFKDQPKPMRQVAAALQNNGRVMLWARDDDAQTWGIEQSAPGGDWSAWSPLQR